VLWIIDGIIIFNINVFIQRNTKTWRISSAYLVEWLDYCPVKVGTWNLYWYRSMQDLMFLQAWLENVPFSGDGCCLVEKKFRDILQESFAFNFRLENRSTNVGRSVLRKSLKVYQTIRRHISKQWSFSVHRKWRGKKDGGRENEVTE